MAEVEVIEIEVAQEIAVIEVEVEPEISVIEVVELLGIQGPPGTGGGVSDVNLETHINHATPHPVYDDALDFTLLFENGLSQNGSGT